VVHLIATEGHAPSGGDGVVRVDLEAEALRLGRLLGELMPDEPEVLSLLALLLLTGARRPARVERSGEPVLLADQAVRGGTGDDRGRGSAARRGGPADRGHRRSVPAAGPPGRPPLHRGVMSWPDTDWTRIVAI